MAEIVRATCPHDCPDACGMLVEVEGGQALAVRGDPDHPWSRGSLCPKTLHYERTVHSERRLTTPLARDGQKGSGRFRPITWDEAIARVAERLSAIAKEHGPEAILPYSYAGTMGMVQRCAGHAFFHTLGASRLDRTICSPALEEGWKALMGATLEPDPEEVVESDLVVLWGIDAVATHVHFVPRAKEARRRGARVLLVETYRSPTAAMADEVFLVRPGSDGALALGMLQVIVNEGLFDLAFVEHHVQGFEAFRREVLAEWSLERSSTLTGLSAEAIARFARAFARARAPLIRYGGGPTRYGNGAMNVRLVACLPALTGAWARRGGGFLGSTSSREAFDSDIVQRSDFDPKPARLVNMNRLGHALGELDDPRVMALFVYCSNPAAVAPDQNAVLRGLGREDLFTVVHERFMTDTARFADVVLPATSAFEHPDLYRSYGSYYVQRVRAAVPPVGEARPNWELFRSLARAMGMNDPHFDKSADELIDEILAAPHPMREGLDRASLEAGRAVKLRLPEGAKLSFRTPSGRIEIDNPALEERLPHWRPTHTEKGALPLRLVTAPALYTLNSSFMEQDELRAKAGRRMPLFMHPEEARARSLVDGSEVVVENELGQAVFELEISDAAPLGAVIAPGVWWLEHAPGDRNVNALTSQRLTDAGGGSTFYDTRVEVRARRAPAVRPIEPDDVESAIAVVREALAEFGLRFGEGATTDAELGDLPGSYRDRGGEFWVALDEGGQLIGTCGMFPVAEQSYELRKMYLRPTTRGKGLGQRLLDAALAWAKEQGAETVVLDTTEQMKRAIAFYEGNGFVRDDSQIRGQRCSRGYVRRL